MITKQMIVEQALKRVNEIMQEYKMTKEMVMELYASVDIALENTEV